VQDVGQKWTSWPPGQACVNILSACVRTRASDPDAECIDRPRRKPQRFPSPSRVATHAPSRLQSRTPQSRTDIKQAVHLREQRWTLTAFAAAQLCAFMNAVISAPVPAHLAALPLSTADWYASAGTCGRSVASSWACSGGSRGSGAAAARHSPRPADAARSASRRSPANGHRAARGSPVRRAGRGESPVPARRRQAARRVRRSSATGPRAQQKCRLRPRRSARQAIHRQPSVPDQPIVRCNGKCVHRAPCLANLTRTAAASYLHSEIEPERHRAR